mgnify:CR=1 FL=1
MRLNNLGLLAAGVCVATFALGTILATNATADVFTLISSIDEAQANEGNGTGSAATGSATATYDDATGEFAWNIQWTPLEGNITVAHFHGPAAPGANAGVQVNFGAISGLTSPSAGSTNITAQQANDLLGGLWYINIHSDRDAVTMGGEIRGQVLLIPEPATLVTFAVMLLGTATCRWRRRQ